MSPVPPRGLFDVGLRDAHDSEAARKGPGWVHVNVVVGAPWVDSRDRASAGGEPTRARIGAERWA